MTPSKRSKRARSYYAGEKRSNRVRLWAHHRDGTLFLEYRIEDGKRRNLSLGHADRERGKQAADDLAAKLRNQPAAVHLGETTLRLLFDNYIREQTPGKSKPKQRHDHTARQLFEACWGASAKVQELDRRDWDNFINRRRSGEIRPTGRETKGGVRDRMIAYDLKFLMAVCNRAESVRVNGRYLLDRNPFRKFPMPAEVNPRRPSIAEDEYMALLRAAKEVGPQVELFLYICHETGHRSDSVANLRWSDINLKGLEVFWRKDKMRREHYTPLLPEHAEVIRRMQRENPRIGDGWVFPSPEDPQSHVSRRHIVRWWDLLEKRAGIARIAGRGWHSLRRKFADENDELPLSQLMALGGWKSSRTVVEIYQKPNAEKLRNALGRRKVERSADVTTASDNQLSAQHTVPLPQVAATA